MMDLPAALIAALPASAELCLISLAAISTTRCFWRSRGPIMGFETIRGLSRVGETHQEVGRSWWVSPTLQRPDVVPRRFSELIALRFRRGPTSAPAARFPARRAIDRLDAQRLSRRCRRSGPRTFHWPIRSTGQVAGHGDRRAFDLIEDDHRALRAGRRRDVAPVLSSERRQSPIGVPSVK